MRLRPFLIFTTTCLLSACEKKDAAPGSAPPDIASTKSTLRGDEGETRSATRGGERAAKSDAIKAIDRLLHDSVRTICTRNDEGDDAVGSLQAAKAAIIAADPAEFDAIWRKLGLITNRDFREGLQMLAIYHLSARRDLIAARVKVREIMLPDDPDGDWLMLMGNLFTVSDPTPVQAIDYLRQTDSLTQRDLVSKFFPHNRFDREGLEALRTLNPPLTGEECGIVVATLAGGLLNHRGDVLNEDDGTEASQRLETVAALEEQGVFPKGAREAYLANLGISHSDLFVKVVPREELQSYLLKPGYDQVIESIVRGEVIPDPFAPGPAGDGYPHIFFTSKGTQNLPPEKTPLALEVWHSGKPGAAEAWFADNAASLPQLQQDLIHAGFANNTWDEDPVKAQAWVDQISDPALRRKAIAEWEEKRDRF